MNRPKMNSLTQRLPLVATLTAAAMLAACASAPTSNAALSAARADYDSAAAQPQIVRSAPMELRKAQQALDKAEAALRSGAETSEVEHQAYLAKQRVTVARQAGEIAAAEQAVANAALQRDRILIESRTSEAERARVEAERARVAAEGARAEAVAAQKLAQERLAAVQASQAKAATAAAKTRTLEQELAALKAKPTDRGMVLTLGDVLFDTGRAELNPGAARTLDQLAEFLKSHPERTVTIEGYTDSVGSDQLNQELSERRANAVKNALTDRAIESSRISARGLGKASPVASNATAAGRQQNRRVEIVFSAS